MRFLILLMLGAVGCAYSATLTLSDGRALDAPILGGDATTLAVLPEGETETVHLQRSDVVDIDHPGNVMAILGAVWAASGIATGVFLFRSDDIEEDRVPMFFAANVLAVGVEGSVMAVGLSDWLSSRLRAGDEDVETTALALGVGGSVLTALGILMAALPLAMGESLSPGSPGLLTMTAGGGLAAAGVNVMVPAWWVWSEAQTQPVRVSPVVTQSDAGWVYGASVSWTW